MRRKFEWNRGSKVVTGIGGETLGCLSSDLDDVDDSSYVLMGKIGQDLALEFQPVVGGTGCGVEP